MVKNLPDNAENVGSVPGTGRLPGGRNGYQLQCSCMENSMDRGAWQQNTAHSVANSWTQLSTNTHTHTHTQTHIKDTRRHDSILFFIFIYSDFKKRMGPGSQDCSSPRAMWTIF